MLPAVVAAAAAGFGLSYPWGRIDPWAVLAPLLAYVVYAAPVVLSGDPTFTGYIKLDDTATWFALTDRVMEHGRSLDGLAPSSYEATLAFNLADGYPIGAFLPLGVGRALVGQDVAWVFQPYLAFAAAMLAAALYVLAGTVLRAGPVRMLAAVIAAQPALLFGYVLWGGVKEIVGAALIALLATLVALALAEEEGPRDRDLVLIAVTCAAVIAVLSASGGVWLLGILLPASVLVLRRRGALAALRGGALVAIVAAALSVPLFVAGGVVPPTSSPVTSDTAKGNLVEPLSVLQLFGVWPEGDFRFEPDDMLVTYVLVGIVALAAAALSRARLAAAGDRAVGVRRGHGRGGHSRSSRSARRGSTRRRSRRPPRRWSSRALVGAGLLAAGGRRVAGAVVAVAGLRRSAVVERAGLQRGQPGATRPAPGARADRRPDRRRGTGVDDRVRAIRSAALSARGGRRGRVGAAQAGGAAALGRAAAEARHRRHRRVRAGRHPRLPDPRPAPVPRRKPAPIGLSAAVARPVLRRVAAGPGRRGLASGARPAGQPRRAGGATAVRAGAGARPPRGRRGRAAGGRTGSPGRAGRHGGGRRRREPSQTRPVADMPGAVYPGKEARFDATVRVRRPGRLSRLRRRCVPARGSSSRSMGGGSRPGGTASTTTGTTSRWARSSLSPGSHRVEVRYRPAELAPGSGGPAFPLGPLYVVEPANPRVDVVPPATGRAPVRPAAGLDRVRQPLNACARKVRGPGLTRPSLLCN